MSSSDTQPTFSVVICAYTMGRWDELLEAIASVGCQTLPADEIIVVIDHNAELLARLQEKLAGMPRLTICENRQARGLSGGRNTGVALARGKFIAFLDDDAFAAPDWLEQLYDSFKDEQVAGAGGLIQPLWKEGRPGWFPEEFNWVVGCSYRGLPTEPAPVRNMIGCNMVFRREVFEKVGGFRIGRVGTLSVGQENDETEFCIRLSQQAPNTRLLYQPAAAVQHNVPLGRGRLSYYLKRCYSEGLSKARLGRTVGQQSSLATEKTYVRRTLPAGVLRNLAQVALKGDFGGLGRAAAIVMGLSATVLGYGYGKVEPYLARRPFKLILALAAMLS